ncbi:MAG: respiratory nitrate reductase subunit gamma [Candidatus Competibacter sp.]
MSYLNTLLFGVYPYLAGAVFLLGSLARFDRDPFTWKAHSSQMLSNKNMRWASNLFHVGILLLFLGHFVGLLTPPESLPRLGRFRRRQADYWPSSPVVSPALMCFAGLTLLVQRRLNDPRVRATSTRMDIFILLLLYAQLILGLLTIPLSLMHLDGHNMLNLMGWARNIVTFDPAEAVAAITFPRLACCSSCTCSSA